MKTGVCSHPATRRFGNKTAFEMIKRSGFDYIDYGIPSTAGHMYDSGVFALSDAEFEAHFKLEREQITAAGLKVSQVHAPFPTYPDDRPERFDVVVEAIRKAIFASKFLGSPYTVIHCAMRCGWGKDDDPKLTREMNYEVFAKLLPTAKETGVMIALENMPCAHIPSSSPEQLCDFIDMMESDMMCACLDTGHANITGVPSGEFVRKLGKRLRVLHIHDNTGAKDDHNCPYLGNIDWADFSKALAEIGFDGVYSLESDMFPHKFPAVLFEAALKFENETINSIILQNAD